MATIYDMDDFGDDFDEAPVASFTPNNGAKRPTRKENMTAKRTKTKQPLPKLALTPLAFSTDEMMGCCGIDVIFDFEPRAREDADEYETYETIAESMNPSVACVATTIPEQVEAIAQLRAAGFLPLFTTKNRNTDNIITHWVGGQYELAEGTQYTATQRKELQLYRDKFAQLAAELESFLR